jgi:hypothetical protein
MYGDVEALLSRQARQALPIARQFLLYLDPFALFKDASRGNAWQQEVALQYNRAMRWILLPYIRRWITIAAALFLGIFPAEALAAKQSLFIYPTVALAIGCCIAVTVTFCTLTAYLLLSNPRR